MSIKPCSCAYCHKKMNVDLQLIHIVDGENCCDECLFNIEVGGGRETNDTR